MFLILFLFSIDLSAQQQVLIKENATPLNRVLTRLRDKYDLKISFNDDKLATYVISLDQTFPNVEEALKFLLKNTTLNLENSNGVFLITSQKVNFRKQLISGAVIDGISGETLPFTSVKINGFSTLTDQKGNFSYTSNSDSASLIQISHLGYLKLDTITKANNNLEIKLYQNSIKIEEVVLTSNPGQLNYATTNYGGGSLKLNKSVGEYLPGSSDNSIYNILRLQPGVLASGEQANDLIIWGSYQGQTKVAFDGFTVFGLRNFNDNIGAVNPLVSKDLSIKKGGYGVEQGDRVGGVIDIIGIEGSTIKPSLKIGINNLTLNGVASTPLFKNTSLVIAGRQTYYNLYKNYSLTSGTNNRNGVDRFVDLKVKPSYLFNDLNLKFSGKTNKGDNYFVSLFTGNDGLTSSFQTTDVKSKIQGESDENNKQYGTSAFYGKKWEQGSISSLTFASSGLNIDRDEVITITPQNNGAPYNSKLSAVNNQIEENSLKFTHKLPSNQIHSLLLGAGYINNLTFLTKDSANISKVNEDGISNRIYGFSENTYFISPKLRIIPGIRADFDLAIKKVFWQPRLMVRYHITNRFKTVASWGIFNQFIAYNAESNEQGNYSYQWTVNDGKKVPVYKAQHWVGGIRYEGNNFWVNTDFYYKTTDGITKYIQNNKGRNSYVGDGKSYGLDVLIKKAYKGSTGWFSYTYNKSSERFPYIINNNKVNTEYERAPQDQRHELKLASVLNLSPFYLSANYVYGSGFPTENIKGPNNQDQSEKLTYKRFDTALTYKFKARKYQLETGVSILNLFNTQNIKTSNFERIQTGELTTFSIYSQAVPFTPTVFLNFSL